MPSDQGGLDKEAKVGAMLRTMSGDVSAAFERTLKELYQNKKGELDALGESCAKWHWRIVKYAPNPQEMRGYVSMVQFFFDNKIIPDEFSSWKKLMRIVLPEAFLQKMSGYTQVPQIAVMDETQMPTGRGVIDASEVQW